MRTTAYLGLVALLMLGLVAPAVAQDPAPEPADLKAYRPIYDPTTPTDKKADLAEVFLAETSPVFIESTYRENVFLILFQSYKGMKNWTKVLDTVDRIEKLVPKTTSERRVLFYAEAMNIASGEIKPPDTKKTVYYAEKIVAIDGKNVNALLILATAIPEDAQESELNKIMDFAKRVLDLPKPAGATDEQWQGIRSALQVQNQSFVALITLTRKDYVACAKAYEDLTKLTPKDPAAHYRRGICLYYQVRNAQEPLVAANKAHIAFVEECNKGLDVAGAQGCDSDENKAKIEELKVKEADLKRGFEDLRDRAIESFAKAVAIGGAGQEVQAARTELEKLYRTKKPDAEKPLEGLDDLIAQKKKELGD